MTTNVLIVSTHNAARSVLAEGMFNHLAALYSRDMLAFSAGSAPSGHIDALALEVLDNAGVEPGGYRSKNWNEFARPGAPQMRIVVTLCDDAAKEACPQWPGSPLRVHWGYPSPANAEGGAEKKRLAYEMTRQAIAYRMLQLVRLPLETMDEPTLQKALNLIGHS